MYPADFLLLTGLTSRRNALDAARYYRDPHNDDCCGLPGGIVGCYSFPVLFYIHFLIPIDIIFFSVSHVQCYPCSGASNELAIVQVDTSLRWCRRESSDPRNKSA